MRTAGYAIAALGLIGAVGVRGSAGANLVLPLAVHAQAVSNDTVNFSIDPSPANPVYTSWSPGGTPVKERRAIMEFDLSALPGGAIIEYAELLFDVAHLESRVQGAQTLYPSVRFWGYAGNNAIDASDALQTSHSLAQETINYIGPWAVPLNVDWIQWFFDIGAPTLGILTYPNSDNLSLGIWTAADGSIAAPAISLIYSRLEGDFNSDGLVDAADLAVLHFGFANQLTGYANGDFNEDGVINVDDLALFDRAMANFVPPVNDFAAGVPEPAVGGVLALAVVLVPRVPRRRDGEPCSVAAALR